MKDTYYIIIIVVLVLISLKITYDNYQKSNVIDSFKTKDAVLNKKLEMLQSNLVDYANLNKIDICKMKDFYIMIINKAKMPTFGNKFCTSEFAKKFDEDTNKLLYKQPITYNLGEGGDSYTEPAPFIPHKIKLIIIRNNIRDIIEHTLHNHFCKDGVLLFKDVIKYLINIINMICSNKDSTIDNITKTASYYLFKPLEYM
jgi:hypothetical protein